MNEITKQTAEMLEKLKRNEEALKKHDKKVNKLLKKIDFRFNKLIKRFL